MMPLLLAQVGESNLVRRIGGTPEVRRHLEDLGVVVGAPVTIISRIGGHAAGRCVFHASYRITA